MHGRRRHGRSLLVHSARDGPADKQLNTNDGWLPSNMTDDGRPLKEQVPFTTGGRRSVLTKENILARDDLIPAEGTIIDKQPNAFFKVQLDNTEHVVLAAISGKMRKNRIRILVGDRVSVEMSPYDLSRGRITYRYK